MEGGQKVKRFSERRVGYVVVISKKALQKFRLDI